jgi:hypothetical protein
MGQLRLIIEPDADVPEFGTVLADGTVAGRPYRFVLDTGAARTQLPVDHYTTGLGVVTQESSSGAFGQSGNETVVTVTDLAVGPLRAASLDVTRAGDGPGVLGMDVIGRYRCAFRLGAGVVDAGPPAAAG